jgi:hypothetical protein
VQRDGFRRHRAPGPAEDGGGAKETVPSASLRTWNSSCPAPPRAMRTPFAESSTPLRVSADLRGRSTHRKRRSQPVRGWAWSHAGPAEWWELPSFDGCLPRSRKLLASARHATRQSTDRPVAPGSINGGSVQAVCGLSALISDPEKRRGVSLGVKPVHVDGEPGELGGARRESPGGPRRPDRSRPNPGKTGHLPDEPARNSPSAVGVSVSLALGHTPTRGHATRPAQCTDAWRLRCAPMVGLRARFR